MRRPQQDPVLQSEPAVVNILLHHPLEQVQVQQVHFPPDSFRRQGIQDKEIRKRRGLFRIPVHHPRGPRVQVGQLKPPVALDRVNRPEFREFLPGHQEVHVVVPGNEPLVADASQQRSAHQVVFNPVPVADRRDVPKLFQQLLVDFLKREFFLHGSWPPPGLRWISRPFDMFPGDTAGPRPPS